MGNNGNEHGTEYVEVPGTSLQYKTDKVIGTTNYDYFRDMTQEQRTAYQQKTSSIQEYINSMSGNGGDILESVEQFSKTFELEGVTKAVLDRIAACVNAGNITLAYKIYQTKFVTLKHCAVKSALSPGEIQAALNNRNAFMKFYNRFDQMADLFKQGWKKIRTIQKIYDTYQRAKIFIKTNQIPINDLSNYANPFAEARRQRQELIEAKHQMEVLLKVGDSVLALAPTGMKEYIQFNLDAFKAADKALKLIDKYAEDIENALNDIDKLFKEVNQRTFTAQDGANFTNDRNNKGMDSFIWPRKR